MTPRSTGLSLHVYPADLRRTGRTLRHASHAMRYYERVEVAGLDYGQLKRFETLPSGLRIRRFSVSRRLQKNSRLYWLQWYAKIFGHYLFKRVRCVDAHSLSVLPVCWLIARLKRCPLVYQPQEFETEMDFSNNRIGKKLRKACEAVFVTGARRVVTPNETARRWYGRVYGLRNVFAVRNLPVTSGAPVNAGYFAARYKFPETDLVFLYQGLIEHNRGIEVMIEAFSIVPTDRHLVVMGFGSLQPLVEKAAARFPNIHYHPSVPPEELPQLASAAHVGLLMLAATARNQIHCYPEKYCSYLSAGRPVIAAETLRLCRELKAYDCGWAAPSVAGVLAGLVRQIDINAIAQKGEGARLWLSENNWKTESRKLDEVYNGLRNGLTVMPQSEE